MKAPDTLLSDRWGHWCTFYTRPGVQDLWKSLWSAVYAVHCPYKREIQIKREFFHTGVMLGCLRYISFLAKRKTCWNAPSHKSSWVLNPGDFLQTATGAMHRSNRECTKIDDFWKYTKRPTLLMSHDSMTDLMTDTMTDQNCNFRAFANSCDVFFLV